MNTSIQSVIHDYTSIKIIEYITTHSSTMYSNVILNRFTIAMILIGFNAPHIKVVLAVMVFFWACNRFYEKIVQEYLLTMMSIIIILCFILGYVPHYMGLYLEGSYGYDVYTTIDKSCTTVYTIGEYLINNLDINLVYMKGFLCDVVNGWKLIGYKRYQGLLDTLPYGLGMIT